MQRVEPQVFDVLAYLVRNAGRVVRKDELLDNVWGRRHVSDAALTSRIRAARVAVGDDGKRQRLIRTVHGKGYELVAEVGVAGGEADRGPQVERDAGDPPRSRSALPAALKRLIGRETTLYALRDALGESRLLTLVGPGGVGKTSLAYALARAVEPTFRDGVNTVELVSVVEAKETVQALGTALAVHARQDTPVGDAVIDVLRPRHALLLLDNCEHVVDVLAPFVERILQAAPEVTVLATSREPLGAPGERLRPIEPLPLAGDKDLTVEALRASPAVALFAERAVAADPEFLLDQSNARLVAEICRRLDGMPLAIELAAARARTVGIEEMVARLDERFRLLRAVRRGGDSRHQALVDTCKWSYDLLEPEAQSLFAELSVFAGQFEPADAAAVCTAGDGLDTLDLMTALAERSMLVVRRAASSSRRYELLETLRAYGGTLLPGDRRDALRARHARHYASVADAVACMQAGPDEARATERAAAGFANLRTAQRFALDTGDLDAAFALIAAMREYAMRTLSYEVLEWADGALAAPSGRDHPLAPMLLGMTAYGAWIRGEFDRALGLAGEAAERENARGLSPSGLAERVLGNVHFVKGGVEAGLTAVRRQLEHARAAEVPSRIAHGAYFLSIACSSTGAYEEARDLARVAREIGERTGSPTDLASGWVATGFSVGDDLRAALEAFSRGDAIARSAHNRWMSAFATTEASALRLLHGDLRGACTGLAEAVDVWHRAGEWSQQWLTLSRCALALRAIGENELTARLIGAIERRVTLGMPPVASVLRERLAATVAEVTERLGAERFQILQAEGGATPVADVVYRIRAALRGA